MTIWGKPTFEAVLLIALAVFGGFSMLYAGAYALILLGGVIFQPFNTPEEMVGFYKWMLSGPSFWLFTFTGGFCVVSVIVDTSKS